MVWRRILPPRGPVGGEAGKSRNQAGRARLLIVLVLSLRLGEGGGRPPGVTCPRSPTPLQATVPTCCGGGEILPAPQAEGPLPSWPHGTVGWTKAAR